MDKTFAAPFGDCIYAANGHGKLVFFHVAAGNDWKDMLPLRAKRSNKVFYLSQLDMNAIMPLYYAILGETLRTNRIHKGG